MIQIAPRDLSATVDDYFATTNDNTLLSAPGIATCIGGLFYRQGHLGLGHFDPIMDSVMVDLAPIVKPRMEKYGSGDIRCRLFTGESFAAREEFQGGAGIKKYMDYIKRIQELGFVVDDPYTGVYHLANSGPVLVIERLEARLVGDALEKVEVDINYMDEEPCMEKFEIDTRDGQVRVIQPFTGKRFSFKRPLMLDLLDY